MCGHQERPQDYGWKYASGFFPKLNAERFHPPKQNIVSTGKGCALCTVARVTLRSFLREKMKLTAQRVYSLLGEVTMGLLTARKEKFINKCKRFGEASRRAANGLIALIWEVFPKENRKTVTKKGKNLMEGQQRSRKEGSVFTRSRVRWAWLECSSVWTEGSGSQQWRSGPALPARPLPAPRHLAVILLPVALLPQLPLGVQDLLRVKSKAHRGQQQ